MIELRGVSRTVQSGGAPLTILHPLELFVPAGQSLAITGPSGSGKSTLLGLIAGLDAPTSGAIVIDGVDITRLGEDALARLRGDKIGFVFQFFHLIPSLTARENVLVPDGTGGPARRGPARADALLDEVGLRDRGHHYPSQLSGGEQQRVAIARALANDPPILLADEPTGNLDSANGRHIMDLLRRREPRAQDHAGAGDARRRRWRPRPARSWRCATAGPISSTRGSCNWRPPHDVRPAHGDSRDALVVAAAAVLLRLPGHWRRRHRHAALGDSERAGRGDRRSAGPHRRRRGDFDRPRRGPIRTARCWPRG